MLDMLRRYVDAGREALTPKKAQDFAQALVRRGEASRDQASTVARQLLDWSRRNSERFRDTIRREVRKQITRAGLATKAEVEGLRRRVRELERSRPSAAKRSTSKASRPGKAGSRKKATTRKSGTARKKSTSSRPRAAPRPPAGGGSSSG